MHFEHGFAKAVLPEALIRVTKTEELLRDDRPLCFLSSLSTASISACLLLLKSLSLQNPMLLCPVLRTRLPLVITHPSLK